MRRIQVARQGKLLVEMEPGPALTARTRATVRPLKILRRKDTGTVLLVYPSTLDEHRQALETLGRGARPAAGHDGRAMGRTESGPPQGCYVVTTEEQRRRWGLPDLAACGLARVVNESRALELLYEPGDWSAAAELLG